MQSAWQLFLRSLCGCRFLRAIQKVNKGPWERVQYLATNILHQTVGSNGGCCSGGRNAESLERDFERRLRRRVRATCAVSWLVAASGLLAATVGRTPAFGTTVTKVSAATHCFVRFLNSKAKTKVFLESKSKRFSENQNEWFSYLIAFKSFQCTAVAHLQ